MDEIRAFSDGAVLLRGGLRVAGWAFVWGGLIHGGGAPGYSQGRARVSPGDSFRVGIVGTTNTQAVLAYSAPDAAPCTVKVSQQPSLTPLVRDVDPALFPGSDQDTRSETMTAQTGRVFVVGKRITQRVSDGNNYSRALETYPTHYYQLVFRSPVHTRSFTPSHL